MSLNHFQTLIQVYNICSIIFVINQVLMFFCDCRIEMPEVI
ncbi:MAG: hypothetical protein OFPII_28790 [Osedax symbiont Rs1]|nr:MAG: hypothetical protein OFPII_28790 [Osedax symbiont Rs1]